MAGSKSTAPHSVPHMSLAPLSLGSRINPMCMDSESDLGSSTLWAPHEDMISVVPPMSLAPLSLSSHIDPMRMNLESDLGSSTLWATCGDTIPSAEKTINMIHSWQVGQRRKAEALEQWELEPISFPPVLYASSSDAPVVISALIANCLVHRVYTDTGSAAEIMYEHCFCLLPAHVRARLQPPTSSLASFTGEPTWPIGRIELEVQLGEGDYARTSNLEFSVVRSPSRYNVLLGRTALQRFGAVVSTVHGLLKFPTPAGIATLRTMPMVVASISTPPTLPGQYSQGNEGSVMVNPLHPD